MRCRGQFQEYACGQLHANATPSLKRIDAISAICKNSLGKSVGKPRQLEIRRRAEFKEGLATVGKLAVAIPFVRANAVWSLRQQALTPPNEGGLQSAFFIGSRGL